LPEVIDKLFVRVEMLEKSLAPILSRGDVKGEALAILNWIEEIYDGLVELKSIGRMIEESCCQKSS